MPAKGLRDSNTEPIVTIAMPQPMAQVEIKPAAINMQDRAVQTSPAGMDDIGTDIEFDELVDDDDTYGKGQRDGNDDDEEEGEGEGGEEDADGGIDFDADEYDAYLLEDFDLSENGNNDLAKAPALDIHHRASGRRRSVSLNDILGSSYIHEAPSGERIIISRGWPVKKSKTKSSSSRLAKKLGKLSFPPSPLAKSLPLPLPLQLSAAAVLNTHQTDRSRGHRRRSSIVSTTTTGNKARRLSYTSHHNPLLGGLVTVVTSTVSPDLSSSSPAAAAASSAALRRRSISEISIKQVRDRSQRRHQLLNEEQKRRLLVEFLKTQAANEGAQLLAQQRVLPTTTSLAARGTASPPNMIKSQGGRILLSSKNKDDNIIDEITEFEDEDIGMRASREQEVIAMPVVKVNNNSLIRKNITESANLNTKTSGNRKSLANNKVSASNSVKRVEKTNSDPQDRLVERIDSTRTESSFPEQALPSQTHDSTNAAARGETKQDNTKQKDDKTLKKPFVVQYDLPVHSGKPIALGNDVNF